MANWKTNKYDYDGIFFDSQPEIEVYKILKASNFKFQVKPEPIQITPDFVTTMGVKHKGMVYEPDFMVYDENRNVYLEVKSQNDLLFAGKTIKDNSEVVKAKHKSIEHYFSHQKDWHPIGYCKDKFLVVRVNNLKTPEWAGAFWEEEFTQLKKFKTQKKNELCSQVKRIDQTLTEVMTGFYD